jgi:hypothetical protein
VALDDPRASEFVEVRELEQQHGPGAVCDGRGASAALWEQRLRHLLADNVVRRLAQIPIELLGPRWTPCCGSSVCATCSPTTSCGALLKSLSSCKDPVGHLAECERVARRCSTACNGVPRGLSRTRGGARYACEFLMSNPITLPSNSNPRIGFHVF